MEKDTSTLLTVNRNKNTHGNKNDSGIHQERNAYSLVGGILAAFMYTFLIAASKMAVQVWKLASIYVDIISSERLYATISEIFLELISQRFL